MSFKYPESDYMILSDINISIEPNETVALLEKRFGKSTLLKIRRDICAAGGQRML